MVEYTYDAWGNVLSITGMYADTLDVNNPIRYRGYYQDFETGFYYLQSRYYDPAIRRFTNADSVLHNSFLGYNQYAYCYNSPIAYVDTNGNSAQAAFEVWTTGAAPLSAVDGLLPIGDIIYWGGVLILGAIYIFSTVTADNPPLTYEKVDVKVEEKEKEIAISQPYKAGYFYGADMLGGGWKIVTGPMTFEQAIVWIEASSHLSIYGERLYGKGTNWGAYTSEREDAFLLATALGDGVPEHDMGAFGQYSHYHVNGRNLFGYYKHFHVWYGIKH